MNMRYNKHFIYAAFPLPDNLNLYTLLQMSMTCDQTFLQRWIDNTDKTLIVSVFLIRPLNKQSEIRGFYPRDSIQS